MKHKSLSLDRILRENAELRTKLAEAEETINAIRNGDVDALVASGPSGDRVFTLTGVDYTYRLLIENMNEGAATLAPNGTILYCNKRLARMLELDMERIAGNPMSDFIFPQDRETYASIISRAKSGNGRGEVSLVKADGSTVPVNVSSNPLDAHPAAMSIIISDVSELKKAATELAIREHREEALKRDNELLERLAVERAQELFEAQLDLYKARRLSDLGMLSATIAHELRNPLATIRLGIYNVKKKVEDPALKQHLERIDKKVSESNEIINNLLFYSKIKEPSYESFFINEILDECIENMQKRYPGKKCTVKKNSMNLQIEADQVQLKGVINNILNNAFDALPDEGVIEVGLRTEKNDYAVISIEDNGSGIAPEDMEKIFEPFYTTKSKGTGLGLCVCKQIVELHRGIIRVSSTPGKGTIFHVTIPQKKP